MGWVSGRCLGPAARSALGKRRGKRRGVGDSARGGCESIQSPGVEEGDGGGREERGLLVSRSKLQAHDIPASSLTSGRGACWEDKSTVSLESKTPLGNATSPCVVRRPPKSVGSGPCPCARSLEETSA